MPRLRVLCAIPNHPFSPGDVVDADLVDQPNARVAHGWAEWVAEPEPDDPAARSTPTETATAGPPETASRRPARPRKPAAPRRPRTTKPKPDKE